MKCVTIHNHASIQTLPKRCDLGSGCALDRIALLGRRFRIDVEAAGKALSDLVQEGKIASLSDDGFLEWEWVDRIVAAALVEVTDGD